jgi:hypothetical protein
MIEHLKKSWKEMTLLGAWIASVAGSFIIPLPSWSGSTNISSFYLKFIVFFATVVSGFLVLYTFKNKRIKNWYKLSIVSFILLTISIVGYYYARETLTLPYEGVEIVIGNERIENDPLSKLEVMKNISLDNNEIMRHFQGVSQKVWTTDSINQNRIVLIFLLAFSYTITACFIISFCNLIILYKEKYKIEDQAKSI